MILVTGGSGMVGRALHNLMPDATYISSDEYDLRSKEQVSLCFNKINPDIVIHLAARVGGIVANSSQQYDFFYDNIMINTNVIHEACCRGNYIIFVSSTCAYPKNDMTYPLMEDVIFLGEPEVTNRSYAYAKRMGQVQLESAWSQMQIQSCTVYFSNLYGSNDCFDLSRSHFISAAMKKIHDAKINNDKSVELLGTGEPLRQFTYVNDAARALQILSVSQKSGVFNFAYPESVSIKQAAHMIKQTVGYKGEIIFTGQLDGLYCKDVSVQKFRSHFPMFEFTQLDQGITEMYKWYIDKNQG